jgi:hypothetical protein
MKRYRKPLLLIHVIASVGLLGASSSSLSLAIARDDAYDLISLHSAVFGIPLSFIALATGLALGPATKWGVLRYWWTSSKLVLLTLVILNGALLVGPATDDLRSGAGSPALLIAALAGQVLMLGVSVGLSVYKPFGRVKRSRAAVASRRREQTA